MGPWEAERSSALSEESLWFLGSWLAPWVSREQKVLPGTPAVSWLSEVLLVERDGGRLAGRSLSAMGGNSGALILLRE